MGIEFYVSQLLYRYQCVIIPGFGAFISETKSARLVEAVNTFYPPTKSLAFNSHLKINDGLLTNAVSLFEKVSFEQASKIIEKAIIEWQKELDVTGRLSLEDIGYFLKNNEGNLVFEPYLYTNYLTDSFGLTPFVSLKVKRESAQSIINSIVVNDPVILQKERTRRRLPEISITLPKIKFDAPSSSSSYLKYAAIFILGITITGSLIKMYNNNVSHRSILVERAVHEKVENTIQQATFDINIPQTALPLPIKVEKAPYHVVASAFRDLENANAELAILQMAGFNSKILPANEHGLYTVIYASFSNADEARDFLARVKKSYNKNAWLLTKEL